ncbi:sensor histidine kinase [Microbispora hainanensis]|uniref:sensor histidine kinase n=1 Tax=Microbispora hainanensis TaxID=568844 RepID=UPI00142E99A1|nr:HAMP domain-containing sensor histidine kinase [Microbispora hainanensis]
MTSLRHLRDCLGELDELERDIKHGIDSMCGKLYQAIDWQRRFEADVSHELRTPVAGLRAQLEEARLHPGELDVDDLIERALSDVERLQALVDDLYLLAQLQAAAQPAERALLDLGDLVQSELARRTDKHDVKVQVVRGVLVRGVDTRLRRMLSELLDNAQRHAKTVVFVQVRRTAHAAELVVADDGDGIGEEDRERIFDRFTRLDAARSRDRGGTGLGLAIVRNIVHGQEGEVHVERSSAGGAAFVVRLPLA